MKYEAQEFELDMPQPYRDQSANVLLIGQDALTFNLVVSRDVLPKHETLKGVVKKQLQLISNQENFKEMAPQKPRKLSKKNGSALEGLEIFVRFKTSGNIVFQKHVYILLDEKRMLIFVGTARGLWETKEDKTWEHILQSVALR